MKKPQRKNHRSISHFALWIPLTLIVIFVVASLMKEKLPKPEVPVIQTESEAAADQNSNLEVHYLDVGQGDSILIRMPNGIDTYVMLIDTGEQQYAQGLKDYLTELGIHRIDVLVNTHPHADHMGAMADIITEFEIGEIYMPMLTEEQLPTTRVYENLLDAILAKNMTVNPLYEGVYIDAPGDAQIEVYWPKQESSDVKELNNISGVLRLTYGNTSFMFTGDTEDVVEEELVSSGLDIAATVLKCGHHGSSTSTTNDFLQAVQPQLCVISCGAGNRYGHPNEEVLARLESYGCEVYRTDQQGTIIMETDGKQITVDMSGESIEGS